MAGFAFPVDIANRGLQHCGVTKIDPSLGFTENSKAADECGFVYDKLRRAELQRNNWRFSIRECAIRAIDATSMFLSPSLWSNSTTYYNGSLVSDQSGVIWQSNSPANLANIPGNSSQWEVYGGPLAAQPWDNTGTTAYFIGELVYNAPGDGTFSVYQSQQNNNADNPLVPTQWLSSVIYSKDRLVQFAPAWSSITTYAAGAMVTYTDGNTYVSLAGSNLNHIPTLAAFWAPLPVQTATTTAPSMLEWVSTTAYSTGQFVDVNGTQYLAIANSTNAPPATSGSSWVALSGATVYASMIDGNMNNEPDLAPILWSAVTTYASGNKVCGSDGVIYTSAQNGNLNHNPTTDNGTFWTNTNVLCPWTTLTLSGSGSLKWLKLQSPVLTEQSGRYPIGVGPLAQTSTKNAYRLPANFMRKAPQDPKAGSYSWLGAPSNMFYVDWEFEGKFLVSRDSRVIILRFIADVADVTQMDDMFCEGLACRIGLEVCEPLTQSSAKKQTIAAEYNKFMGEARTNNSILVGSEEAALDDYLACRL